MIPQTPDFLWYESIGSHRRIRKELEGKPSDYLEGMIESYESMRIPVAIKSFFVGLNLLSGNVARDSTRLDISRRLLVERGLKKRSTPELERIAQDRGLFRGILWDIKNAIYYDVNHERHGAAKDLLRKRMERRSSLQTS